MKNADEPAFPYTDGVNFAWNGMSKREYFAVMAMQGFIIRNDEVEHERFTDGRTRKMRGHEIAELSIDMADELLKQLEK